MRAHIKHSEEATKNINKRRFEMTENLARGYAELARKKFVMPKFGTCSRNDASERSANRVETVLVCSGKSTSILQLQEVQRKSLHTTEGE